MLHWGDCLQVLESLVPQAAGGSNLDDTLRATLVPFANNVMAEIGKDQRWPQGLKLYQIPTVAGTQSYDVPGILSSAFTGIKRVWWSDANGKVHQLVGMDRFEVQRVYNDPVSTSNRSQPLKYALLPDSAVNASTVTPSAMKLVVYPTPDASGPSSGVYTLNVELYLPPHPIVETTGTTAASTTLTVPSTAYLQDRQVEASNQERALIVRDAGFTKIGTTRDWFRTGWTNAFATGTTVTMVAQPEVVVSAKQTFFYAANWIIEQFPQVLIFGTLREIASYWGTEAQYQKWEVRFHDQMERMAKAEQSRLRGYDVAASAHVGANTPTLRRPDTLTSIDIRGGS